MTAPRTAADLVAEVLAELETRAETPDDVHAAAEKVVAALAQHDLLQAPLEEISWPLVERLRKPEEIFGTTITELSLREPKAADLVKYGVLEGTISGSRMLEMIATLAGLTPRTADHLPADVTLRLSTKLMHFFAQAAR